MSPALAALLLLAAQETAEPGLVGEYFDIGEEMDDFPSLKGRTPVLTRIDAQVKYESTDGEFAGTKLKDRFYVRWTGILRVPDTGERTFGLNSDDGSRLFIDGKLVIDHGGIHDMKEAMKGKATLTKGDHEIRIDFFDNDRGAGCIASWEIEGSLVPIPAAALFHTKKR